MSASEIKKRKSVRNVCILAHVDHGKTTLADSLIATNGHISKRIAGNIRYLDDRKDEQDRGITMKSSAISLSYTDASENSYIINLVDTPGHIDFATEVSAAIRICDGTLIVVDIIEGVCVQTREVLKQAFEERVKMVLIINKLDRMIVEQQKSKTIIFQSICRIVEDCNAYMAELVKYNLDSEVDEEEYLFSPDKGNVIFGSAVDCWGVTTKSIAKMFIEYFPEETVESLNSKLWNFDYYVSKGKCALGAINKQKPNLFESLLLETIYYVYFTLRVRLDKAQLDKIVTKLKIAQQTSEMKHTDPKVQVRAILQAWQPLAQCVLNQIVEVIPAPTSIHRDRYESLINSKRYYGKDNLLTVANRMIEDLSHCTKYNVPTIAYVSKMFAVSKKMLGQEKFINIITGKKKDEVPTEEKKVVEESNEDDCEYGILALTRVFTGALKSGQEIYVLHPNYVPTEGETDVENNPLIKKVTIKQIYVLLGRELLATDSVSAGHICGISGLDVHIPRSATLSSSLNSLPLHERITLEPVVRNSIECQNLKDLPLLRKGLKFLKQIDSCVQVLVQENGELVLITAGDVHLAKCIEDVTSMFSDLKLNISKPMVSLKETIIVNKVDFTKNEAKCDFGDINMKFQVAVQPLSNEIIDCITNNFEVLRIIEDNPIDEVLIKKVKEQLKSVFVPPWDTLLDKIWSIGKSKDNINILFNNTRDYSRNIFTKIGTEADDCKYGVDPYIIQGFDMCCRAGPIAEEPVTECAFIVNLFALENAVEAKAQIALGVRDGFRDAFQKQTMRIMEPMFTMDIEVNTTILGKVYSVIARRHGKVLDAIGMDENEKVFMVKAVIPVAESHDFANEIRKTTSGQANPYMRFSHYEVIDGDPYFSPSDIDEDEDENDPIWTNAKRARQLRIDIRKRKGLKVDDQVVVHAEKQRTLNKKK